MNYIELSGSNYNIGYKVGRWWAEYFLRNREVEAVKTFLRWYDYIDYLKHSWDVRHDRHAPLLRNTMRWYPEIIEEIAGMEKGVSDAFHHDSKPLSVSFLDMFCLTLGETDDPDYNCSSAVIRTPRGCLLVHNDEYTTQYPLLMARVALKTNAGVRRFISVSYPFQLMGSAAGMNGFLAFSGNSIGCKKQMAVLSSTWNYRIPKPVFSRKLLEVETIKEAKDLLSLHHTTLPNHLYIIFKKKAYSIQIRPSLLPFCDPGDQVSMIEIGRIPHFHTNHFKHGEEVDMEWNFNRLGEMSSIRRYKYLSMALKNQLLCDDLQIKKVFLEMAQNHRFQKQTAASLFFKVAEKRSSLEGHFYFASGFKKCVFINHNGRGLPS